MKKLEETCAVLEDSQGKLVRERKLLEERNTELTTKLAEEEEKGKHLGKMRSKFESQMTDVEEQLNRERQVRIPAPLQMFRWSIIFTVKAPLSPNFLFGFFAQKSFALCQNIVRFCASRILGDF